MLTSKKDFITSLFNEKFKFDSNTKSYALFMHNVRKDSLAGDLYINELEQNADDAGAKAIEFILDGDFLIVRHSGKHFNEQDVAGIADTANDEREKTRDLKQTGNKGIGFKSVFSKADSVAIFSDGYQFRFEREYEKWKGKSKVMPWEIIPIWTEITYFPEHIHKHINPDMVNFILKINNQETIHQITAHLDKLMTSSRYLLFLKNIQKINFTNLNLTPKQSKTIEIKARNSVYEEEGDDFQIEQIITSGNNEWLIYTRSHPLPAKLRKDIDKAVKNEDLPLKYQGLTAFPISIAVRVIKGKLAAFSNIPNIFCYLPTKINLGTKFLANTEFLLDTSRTGFRIDNIGEEWNRFACQALFSEQFNFLYTLAIRSPHDRTLLTILSVPNIEDEKLGISNLQSACQISFDKALNETPLILDLSGKYLNLIPQSLMDPHRFIEKFGDGNEKELCIHPEVENQELAKSLTAPEKSKEFLEYLWELYQSLSDEDKKKLITAFNARPLILSSRKSLFQPSKIYFTEEEFKYATSILSSLSVIHSILAKSETATNWLKIAGVAKLNPATIIHHANDSPNLVKFTKHALIKARETGLGHSEKLRGLKVKTRSGELALPENSYLPDVYQPETPLEQFLPEDNFLLSTEYQLQDPADSDRTFFTAIGVKDNLTIDNLAAAIALANQCPESLVKFTQIIFRLFFFKKSSNDIKGLKDIFSTLKIITDKQKTLPIQSVYLSDVYQPELPLEQELSLLDFVSTSYLSNSDSDETIEWRSFFRFIGVLDQFDLTCKTVFRIDFLKDHPNATSYFQYLENLGQYQEKNGGMITTLCPSATRNYMEQHYVTKYVQIPFLDMILLSPFFWKLLRMNWEKISTIKNALYVTKRSSVYIPSNIHFYVMQVIQQHYGENFIPETLYTPHIKEKLGEDANQLPMADIVSILDDEQLSILGFKISLSWEDCISLLNKIASRNSGIHDFRKIVFIYQNMIKNLGENPEIKLPTNIPLLSEANTFETTELHWAKDARIISTGNKKLIKKPETISGEDFEKLCLACNISVLQTAQLSTFPVIDRPDISLREHIDSKLIYILHLEAVKMDMIGTEMKDEMKHILTKIEEKLDILQCYSHPQLSVQFEDIINQAVDCWIDPVNTTIYHNNFSDLDIHAQQTIYIYVYKILELKQSADEFLSILSSPISKLNNKYGASLVEPKLAAIRAIQITQEPKRQLSLQTSTNSSQPSQEEDGDPMETQEHIPTSESNISSSLHLVSSSSPPYKRSFAAAGLPSSELMHSSTSSNPSSKRSLTLFNGPISSFITQQSKEQRIITGKEGEQIFYDFLRAKHVKKFPESVITDNDTGYTIKDNGLTKDIIWLNKNGESGAHHDIEIRVTREIDGIQQIKTRFLEVKTTSNQSNIVEINYSTHEWAKLEEIAQNNAQSYRTIIVQFTGERAIIHKKNLSAEISEGRAKMNDYKRITIGL